MHIMRMIKKFSCQNLFKKVPSRLVRTALYCNSVITVVLGCIPFIKWEEMVVEGCLKKKFHQGYVMLTFNIMLTSHYYCLRCFKEPTKITENENALSTQLTSFVPLVSLDAC